MERRRGSFKARLSSNGRLPVPYCGFTENVRSISVNISGELLLTGFDYLSGLREKRHLVRYCSICLILSRLILR